MATARSAGLLLAAIVNDGGDSSAGAFADYDNDGFLDLFVANYGSGQVNFLYHNDGPYQRSNLPQLSRNSFPVKNESFARKSEHRGFLRKLCVCATGARGKIPGLMWRRSISTSCRARPNATPFLIAITLKGEL
jgi:hypothetical protein